MSAVSVPAGSISVFEIGGEARRAAPVITVESTQFEPGEELGREPEHHGAPLRSRRPP